MHEAVLPKRLQNIQAIRTIAALMVCAFHLQYLFMNEGETKPFPNGEMGVQVFFVISGLIMYHTTRDQYKSNNPLAFLLNRIIRIVPLYLLVTFVYVADDLSADFIAENASRILTTVFFIAPMTDVIGPKYGYPLLDVGWTLNYEMFFYLLFGLSMFVQSHRYWLLIGAFVSIGVLYQLIATGSFDPSYITYHDYPHQAMNFYGNPIVLLFALGVLAGMVLDRIQLSRKAAVFIFGITSICFINHVLAWWSLPVNVFTDTAFVFTWVLAAALCDKANVQVFPASVAKSGDSSYSLYLWHPVVFAYLRTVAEKMGLPYLEYPWMSFLLGLISAMLVAWFSFKVIETRVTNFLRQKISML
ncbi:MAG: acyltransferase family protein [Bacteroidia bacterium]